VKNLTPTLTYGEREQNNVTAWFNVADNRRLL